MFTHVKYEGPNCYQSTDMANVNVFADKQTDKKTQGQTDSQKLYAPDLSMRGHKKYSKKFLSLDKKFYTNKTVISISYTETPKL